jgi:hypothetical protein
MVGGLVGRDDASVHACGDRGHLSLLFTHVHIHAGRAEQAGSRQAGGRHAPPEGEGLEGEVVLALVGVREAGAVLPLHDGEGVARLHLMEGCVVGVCLRVGSGLGDWGL